jgi:hypothetical protein
MRKECLNISSDVNHRTTHGVRGDSRLPKEGAIQVPLTILSVIRTAMDSRCSNSNTEDEVIDLTCDEEVGASACSLEKSELE